MKKITLMMLVAFACICAVAQDDAEPMPHRDRGDRFASLDTDGDGQISPEEFSVKSQNHFARIDADGDGFISQEEMGAMRRHRGERRRPGGHRFAGMLIGLSDADKSGDVTAEEWSSFLASITVEGTQTIDVDLLHEQARTLHESREAGDHPRGHGEGHREGMHRESRGERPAPYGEGAGPGDVDHNGVFETTDLNLVFSKLDADGDGALSSEELPSPPHREVEGGGRKHRRH